MKKAVAIAIGLIYLLLTAGVQIHQHYCCGKLKEVSFTGAPDHCCQTEHKSCSISHKCCDVKEINLKLVDEHRTPELDLIVPAFTAVLNFLPPISFTTSSEVEVIVYADSHAPPVQRDLYTKYCSLIVYG
jgi:hypothetical protein